MGRQTWRFEGQAFESPQISVFDPHQGIPFALLQIILQRAGSAGQLLFPVDPGSRVARPGFSQTSRAYLSSTFAPAFSSWPLILSASSLFTLSLTGLGAPSTRSLASFRPRPVMARTSLMTSIFLSPAAASTTVNSVFSSTGAAAAPPPAGPATAT